VLTGEIGVELERRQGVAPFDTDEVSLDSEYYLRMRDFVKMGTGIFI
jgi:hypothetical protein